MKFRRSFAFILLAAALHAPGQTYTAAKVVFSQRGPYTQAQLEAASGIHPGTSFNADELGSAAQRLIDSGFFDNVGATLQGSVSASTVLFDTQPTKTAQMVRIGFENFVWLTPAEITAALQAKAPLFTGYLPETSPLADIFDAALVDALATKGITAKVIHSPVEPTILQPQRAIVFRIASPAVRVAHVKLAGVTPSLVPLVQKSVNNAVKAPYNEGLDGQTTTDVILAPLLDAGYAQASLSGISIAPALSGETAEVELSATLSPGEVYRVSSTSFVGTPLMSAEAFAASAKLHPGDVASRAALLETLAPLDLAYRSKGFIDVVVTAAPTANMANHQIAYNVSVDPGEPYKVREVTANGLDPAGRADFDRGFLMKPGEIYNPEYVRDFLRKNTALLALAPYRGAWKSYADPNTHMVDVVLTFYKAGRN
jgi:outer membrane protein assembly factor BamA